MRIINLVLNTSFFTFYFNYLSYLHFPFICNETTLPLTITVKLPKRWNQTSELLKRPLTLGRKENRLKAAKKPLHWGQFFYFSLERMAKNILYVLDYYLPHKGGVETVFEQIIGRSLQEGYEVIVLTWHYVYKSKVNSRYINYSNWKNK